MNIMHFSSFWEKLLLKMGNIFHEISTSYAHTGGSRISQKRTHRYRVGGWSKMWWCLALRTCLRCSEIAKQEIMFAMLIVDSVFEKRAFLITNF